MAAPTDKFVVSTNALRKPVEFAFEPGADERESLSDKLGIQGIRKLRFRGTIIPERAADLRLVGELGVTVVQSCVVTGTPVVTRVEETVERRYLAEFLEPEGEEVEMPEDESAEALPEVIDLVAVMTEELTLALPAWPRAAGVEPVDITVTEPGAAPLSDKDVRPFAGLEALKARMENGDGET